MNKTIGLALFLLFSVLTFPISGSAISINPEDLVINFQDQAWETGRKTRSIDVNGVTAAAFAKKVNHKGKKRYLHQNDLNGMGVRGGKSNGIDSFERLIVRFDGETAISGVWIADLFGPNSGGNKRKGEMGRLVINDGEYVFDFYGKDSDAQTGDQYIGFGEDIYISKAVFKVLGGKGNRWQKASDFWVAGFTHANMDGDAFPLGEMTGETGQNDAHASPAPVPEPATLLLMGAGLAGLLGMGRKKI